MLDLNLNKRGVVRKATVIEGPTALREAAIKAVKKHNYKHQMDVFPGNGEITVEVRFPQDNASSPEIRQVLPAGIPSCVPIPEAVRVSSEVMQTYLLNKVNPVYPPEAQHVEEATLVLRVHIDKDGNVYKAEKVSGPDLLVPAATEAVRRWKYRPFTVDGVPKEVETTVDLK